MTEEQIEELTKTDENGCFLNLIIPANEPFESENNKEELNLIGRKKLELDIDEIVRVKKYIQKLYKKD